MARSNLPTLLFPMLAALAAASTTACGSAAEEEQGLLDDAPARSKTNTAAPSDNAKPSDHGEAESALSAPSSSAPSASQSAACAPGVSCSARLTCNVAGACSCGNGVVDPGEECDTADPNLKTSCSSSCMIPCVQDEACTPAAGRRGKIDCTSGSRVCKDIGPTQEVCGNNIDDDGDGVVDDGCVVRVPVPRTMAGNGTGSYIVGTTCYQSGNGTGTVGTNFNAKNYCKGRGYSDTNGKWQCGRDGYVDWVECVR